MKISYSWLKDYVDVKFPPEKLAETLTMAGLSVESVENKGSDHILEIEITANRPDWLSYVGVAREVAAITGRKLKIPSSVVRRPSSVARNTKYGIRTTVRVEDKALCPRYTARIIRNVKVGASPEWLKTKIDAMGLRAVNSVVDITNFCLFETGEPMHAFDLDKIEGDVVVRRARQGEKITAIDGIERSLDSSMLVIADSKGAIAVAGVMGGLRTEVTGSTKNILLEAAYFDPVSIRRTSRKLGLSTESSYRFERKVSISNILYASDRALSIIKDIAGGQIGALADIGVKKINPKPITLKLAKLNKTLGAVIAPAKAKAILCSLGIKVSSSSGLVKAIVPDFRCDLKTDIDLIEEVARIYGYNNIPITIPAITEQPVRIPREIKIRQCICASLASLGFDEVKTYTLVSKKSLNLACALPEEIVEISNPLSAEQEAMRTGMLPGMLGAVAWNINRKSRNLKLFETGGVYIKEDGERFSERESLAICITGEISSGWTLAPRPAGPFDLKGAVETVLVSLGIGEVTFVEANDARFAPGSCAVITIGDEPAGVIGQVSRKVAGDFDIKDKIYFAEICVSRIRDSAKLEKRFAAVPKYPSVLRDISIIVPETVRNAVLVSSVRRSAGELLKSITLIDRYAGKQIPGGKISLTYRLEYQNPGKTLEEKEVSDVHARVLRALEENFEAKQR